MPTTITITAQPHILRQGWHGRGYTNPTLSRATITVVGPPLGAAIQLHMRTVLKAGHQAIGLAGAMLLYLANEFIPIDTGYMKSTGRVRSGFSNQYTREVIVSYSADYSLFVHEDLTARHGMVYNAYYAQDIAAGLTHSRRPQEKPMWFEDTLNQNRDRLMLIIVNHLRAVLP